jgi:hypothetical protein
MAADTMAVATVAVATTVVAVTAAGTMAAPPALIAAADTACTAVAATACTAAAATEQWDLHLPAAAPQAGLGPSRAAAVAAARAALLTVNGMPSVAHTRSRRPTRSRRRPSMVLGKRAGTAAIGDTPAGAGTEDAGAAAGDTEEVGAGASASASAGVPSGLGHRIGITRGGPTVLSRRPTSIPICTRSFERRADRRNLPRIEILFPEMADIKSFFVAPFY